MGHPVSSQRWIPFPDRVCVRGEGGLHTLSTCNLSDSSHPYQCSQSLRVRKSPGKLRDPLPHERSCGGAPMGRPRRLNRAYGQCLKCFLRRNRIRINSIEAPTSGNPVHLHSSQAPGKWDALTRVRSWDERDMG